MTQVINTGLTAGATGDPVAEQFRQLNEMTLGAHVAPTQIGEISVSPQPSEEAPQLSSSQPASTNTAQASNLSPTEVSPEVIKSVLLHLMQHPDQMPTWFRKHFVSATPEIVEAVLRHFKTCPQDIPPDFVIDLAEQFLVDRANDSSLMGVAEFDALMQKQAYMTNFINLYIDRLARFQGMCYVPRQEASQAIADTLVLKHAQQSKSRWTRAWEALLGRDQKPFEAITEKVSGLIGNKIALERAVEELKAVKATIEQQNKALIASGQRDLAQMQRDALDQEAKRQEEMSKAFKEATEKLLAIQLETLQAQKNLVDLRESLDKEAAGLRTRHAEEIARLTVDAEKQKQAIMLEILALRMELDQMTTSAGGAQVRVPPIQELEQRLMDQLTLFDVRYRKPLKESWLDSKIRSEIQDVGSKLVQDLILSLAHIEDLYGEDKRKEIALRVEIKLSGNALERLAPMHMFHLPYRYCELIYRALSGENLAEVARVMKGYKESDFSEKERVRLQYDLWRECPKERDKLTDGCAGTWSNGFVFDRSGRNLGSHHFAPICEIALLLGVDILDPVLARIIDIPSSTRAPITVNVDQLATLCCLHNVVPTRSFKCTLKIKDLDLSGKPDGYLDCVQQILTTADAKTLVADRVSCDFLRRQMWFLQLEALNRFAVKVSDQPLHVNGT